MKNFIRKAALATMILSFAVPLASGFGLVRSIGFGLLGFIAGFFAFSLADLIPDSGPGERTSGRTGE